MAKKSIVDLKPEEIKTKKILVRVDFNVPLNDNLEITDDTRIRAALPTINYLKEKGAKLILVSHLGRPKGTVKAELKLDPVAERLEKLTGVAVKKVDDCIGQEVEAAVESLAEGEMLLLENVRFYKEETDNDEAFAKKLASLADLYVNDAFGTAHRAHASTAGVAEFLPAVMGLLIEKEISFLGSVLENPKKPLIAILGGAKVSSKIGVIRHLLGKVDTLIIAGGMAYTFLKARGVKVGRSLVEEDKLELAKEILIKAINQNTPLLLPIDHVVTDEIKEDGEVEIVPRMGIPDDRQGVDIGPDTRKKFSYAIQGAGTVLWNGPMGVFEIDKFAEGTFFIANTLAKATQDGTTTIIGGGDSVAAVEKAKVADKMTHISTGGGASLEFLEGRELPGIACLLDK